MKLPGDFKTWISKGGPAKFVKDFGAGMQTAVSKVAKVAVAPATRRLILFMRCTQASSMSLCVE